LKRSQIFQHSPIGGSFGATTSRVGPGAKRTGRQLADRNSDFHHLTVPVGRDECQDAKTGRMNFEGRSGAANDEGRSRSLQRGSNRVNRYRRRRLLRCCGCREYESANHRPTERGSHFVN
jgi:hypothetical protein